MFPQQYLERTMGNCQIIHLPLSYGFVWLRKKGVHLLCYDAIYAKQNQTEPGSLKIFKNESRDQVHHERIKTNGAFL